MIWARVGLIPRGSPTNLFRFWAQANPSIKQLLAHQNLYRLDTQIPIAWNCLWSVMPLLDHRGPNLLCFFFFLGKTTWWLQGLGIYKPSRDKNRVRDILVFWALSVCLWVWLWLLFKVFFTYKSMPIMLFYFLKIIFEINTSKWFENIKKHINLKQKKINFFKKHF